MSHNKLVLPQRDHAAKLDYERDMYGNDIKITFELSNGMNVEYKGTVGETVAQLKKFLQDNHQIPFQTQTMLFNGETLIDPLSLNDYPNIVNQSAIALTVKIAGAGGDQAQHKDAQSKYAVAEGGMSVPGAINDDDSTMAASTESKRGMGAKQKTVTFNDTEEEISIENDEEEEKKACCVIL